MFSDLFGKYVCRASVCINKRELPWNSSLRLTGFSVMGWCCTWFFYQTSAEGSSFYKPGKEAQGFGRDCG